MTSDNTRKQLADIRQRHQIKTSGSDPIYHTPDQILAAQELLTAKLDSLRPSEPSQHFDQIYARLITDKENEWTYALLHPHIVPAIGSKLAILSTDCWQLKTGAVVTASLTEIKIQLTGNNLLTVERQLLDDRTILL